LFRLLALPSGPHITAQAAASLAGAALAQARSALAELAGAHLVTESSPGRFSLHDLLRVYATELARTLEPDTEQRAATQRLLDYYVHTAYNAALMLHPRRGGIILASPSFEFTPHYFNDYQEAWTWLEDEYPVLLALIQMAAADGWSTHAWQLPWTLVEFFERRGLWRDWVITHHAAVAAAQRLGDKQGQAQAWRGLGRACLWLGQYDDAYAHFSEALGFYEEIDDQVNQAYSHIDLGRILGRQGHLTQALPHHLQALALSQAAGDRLMQARALNGAGWIDAQLGDYGEALKYCRQAIILFQELGDRYGEAITLESLSYAHRHMRDSRQAITYDKQALVIYEEVGDLFHQAMVLDHLGDAHHNIDDRHSAQSAWRRALDILDHLNAAFSPRISADYPNASQIQVKRRRLDISDAS
jgi:tetratricopeptide (TPR) repeat protein